MASDFAFELLDFKNPYTVLISQTKMQHNKNEQISWFI